MVTPMKVGIISATRVMKKRSMSPPKRQLRAGPAAEILSSAAGLCVETVAAALLQRSTP